MSRSLLLVVASVSLKMMAIFTLVVFISVVTRGDIVDHTIRENIAIKADFIKSSAYIKDNLRQFGSFPSESELRNIPGLEIFDRGGALVLHRGDRGAVEAERRFGPIPDGEYILAYWRGEWMEYFAPWSGISTLATDESVFYFLGSQIADAITSGIVFLICVFGLLLIRKIRLATV